MIYRDSGNKLNELNFFMDAHLSEQNFSVDFSNKIISEFYSFSRTCSTLYEAVSRILTDTHYDSDDEKDERGFQKKIFNNEFFNDYENAPEIICLLSLAGLAKADELIHPIKRFLNGGSLGEAMNAMPYEHREKINSFFKENDLENLHNMMIYLALKFNSFKKFVLSEYLVCLFFMGAIVEFLCRVFLIFFYDFYLNDPEIEKQENIYNKKQPMKFFFENEVEDILKSHSDFYFYDNEHLYFYKNKRKEKIFLLPKNDFDLKEFNELLMKTKNNNKMGALTNLTEENLKYLYKFTQYYTFSQESIVEPGDMIFSKMVKFIKRKKIDYLNLDFLEEINKIRNDIAHSFKIKSERTTYELLYLK